VSGVTRPLRVGVIGLGVMGMRYATALSSMDGLVYAGAADHGAPRTALGQPVVASLADLLAVGVDACVVATPTPDHVHTSTALAEAGVPTLVEKPLAMEPQQCAQVAAAFTRAGVLAAVGHVERFHTTVRELRVALARGDLGPVVRVATRRESGPPRRRDGGVLLDLGTHDFDLTRWLTGLSHERVSAHSTDDGPGTDAAEVVATLSGGAEATHRFSWRSQHPAREIEVHCAGGVLVADTREPGSEPPIPVQLRAFADLVLGRLDPADAGACASLSDGQYAVEVAARAARALLI
jgi:UDP-N-acetylglucosamine 3-dehydrogenase